MSALDAAVLGSKYCVSRVCAYVGAQLAAFHILHIANLIITQAQWKSKLIKFGKYR